MKRLYELSQKLEENGFFSANAVYVALRTVIIFIPSLLVSFLFKNMVHFPAASPTVFVITFTGWVTVIFGFWGGLLYLMRRD